MVPQDHKLEQLYQCSWLCHVDTTNYPLLLSHLHSYHRERAAKMNLVLLWKFPSGKALQCSQKMAQKGKKNKVQQRTSLISAEHPTVLDPLLLTTISNNNILIFKYDLDISFNKIKAYKGIYGHECPRFGEHFYSSHTSMPSYVSIRLAQAGVMHSLAKGATHSCSTYLQPRDTKEPQAGILLYLML